MEATLYDIPISMLNEIDDDTLNKQKNIFISMQTLDRVGLLTSVPSNVDDNTNFIIDACVNFYLNGNLLNLQDEDAAMITYLITDSLNVSISYTPEDSFPKDLSHFPKIDYIDILMSPSTIMEDILRLHTPAISSNTAITFRSSTDDATAHSLSTSINKSMIVDSRSMIPVSQNLISRIKNKYKSLLFARENGAYNMSQTRSERNLFNTARDNTPTAIRPLSFFSSESGKKVDKIEKMNMQEPDLINTLISFYFNPSNFNQYIETKITPNRILELLKPQPKEVLPSNVIRLNDTNIEEFLTNNSVMQRYEIYG
jgi:hypothetical protein